MYTSPKEIAKLFRESVNFDFKKENISSFHQIEATKDDFYTLLDREAFCALLNDFLYDDNQLLTIFVDIYDSEHGFHAFANKNASNAPRSRINYFLNEPKYQYHSNNIAKVYLAFNAWLEFYGYGSITPDWKRCPFCSSAVKDGVCTNSKCKKTTADCIKASSEMALLLADEKAGKQTPTPAYWDNILTGSEFFAEYKAPLNVFKENRAKAATLLTQKQRDADILAANEELNQISATLQIETGKTTPDFDSILLAIANAPKIKNATKYNDAEFNRKINDFKKEVAKKKNEYEKVLTEKKNAQTFYQDVSRFLLNCSTIEHELVSETISIFELKSIFEETNLLYSKVVAGLKLGYEIRSQETLKAIEKYDKETHDLAANHISSKEHFAILANKHKELISKVNLILNDFNGVTPQDNKSSQIAEHFSAEIETNSYYDDFRVENAMQYSDIVSGIRKKLSELIKLENEIKIADFKKQTDQLSADLKNARPQDYRSANLQRKLTAIRSNAYFESIHNNGEYVRTVNILSEKILILKNNEVAYKKDAEARRKLAIEKRRRAVKTIIIASIAVAAIAIVGFVSELSGILPFKMVLAPISDQFTGEADHGQITITGYSGYEKNVTVEKEQRLPWSFSLKDVTTIGAMAFEGSGSLETVLLPDTIEKIDDNAFSSCPKLKRITLESVTPPSVSSNAFDGSNVVIYVPQESYNAYIQHKQWSKFANNIFPNYNNNDLSYGTIIFDSTGGTKINDIAKQKLNSLCNTLPSPTRQGYSFLHWTYISNGTEKVFDPEKTVLTESVKLFAKWQGDPYALTFDCDGGSVANKEMTVINGSPYGKLPTPTKNGYIFEGWYYNNSRIDESSSLKVSADHTVKAKWTPIEYTISYVLNGGSMNGDSFTYKFDQSFTLPIPTKAGYKFLHWEHDGKKYYAGETANNISNKDSDVVKFYAIWEGNLNEVVFSPNGGHGTMSALQIRTGNSQNLPQNAFYRDGYSFRGWSMSPNGSVVLYDEDVFTMSEQETVILYAVWSANSSKVTLNNINGETVIDTRDLFAHTDETVILSNPFKKPGYTLLGWSETPNGEIAYDEAGSYTIGANDTNLYAVWKANTNELFFDANTGTGSMSALYVGTDSVIELPKNQFAKAGYSFVGWATSPDGEAIYDDASSFTMGVEPQYMLYAIWGKETYKINYVIADGKNNEANPSNYNIDSNLIELKDPTRAGYVFSGWYSDEALTSPQSTIPAGSSGAKTFYAKWTANINTLKFNSNGGSGSMSDVKIATGKDVNLPSNSFTKKGYTFIGWKKTSNADELPSYPDQGNYLMGSESTYTLYAVWEKDTYTISYVLNGGVNDPDNYKIYTIDSLTVTPKKATREGYSFLGWYSNSGLTTACNSIPSGSVGNVTLYAKWKANANTLHFDANGGTGSMSDITINTDEKYTLPANKFTRNGYTFIGWKVSDLATIGATYQNSGSYLMGPATKYILYATWAPNTYDITYVLNGGSNNSLNPIKYNIESTRIQLATPTKDGYTFAGWFTDSALTKSITAIETGSTGNISLYAKWTINSNTVVFDPNGGSGSMPSQNGDTGATITLSGNTFTKDGAKFAGWSTSKNGPSMYCDQSKYVMSSLPYTTLYAVWSTSEYTVQYDVNGGINNASNPSGYNTDSETIKLQDPTRDGYTFAGWYKESSYTNAVSEIASGSTANLTLYAKWTTNSYQISYNLNGGTASASPKNVTFGQKYGTLPVPTKTGYKFVGWYYGDKQITAESTVTVSSNHVLVAKWEADKYIVSFDFDGGVGVNYAQTIAYGSSYGQMPSATKAGHTFDGWYYNGVKIESTSQMNETKHHILTAKWVKNSHPVTFDYNGGSGTLSQKQIIYGDAYGELPTATLAGNSYKWYYGDTEITDTTIMSVDKPHTLVAKWTPNNYRVYINEDNVKVTVVRNDTGTRVTSGSLIPYGTSLSVSFTTNAGYSDGWCDYADMNIVWMPNENLVINSGATKAQ